MIFITDFLILHFDPETIEALKTVFLFAGFWAVFFTMGFLVMKNGGDGD